MKNIKEILNEAMSSNPTLSFELNHLGTQKPDYIILDPLSGKLSNKFEYSFATIKDIEESMENNAPEDPTYADWNTIRNLKFGEMASFEVQYNYHQYYIRISK